MGAGGGRCRSAGARGAARGRGGSSLSQGGAGARRCPARRGAAQELGVGADQPERMPRRGPGSLRRAAKRLGVPSAARAPGSAEAAGARPPAGAQPC